MNKAKIERKLNRYQKIYYIFSAIMWISFLSSILMLVVVFVLDVNDFQLSEPFSTLSVISIFVFFFLGGFVMNCRNRVYDHIKNKVVREVAEAVIDQYVYDLVYDPKATLINFSSTPYDLYLALPPYDKVEASDHITGIYKGRSIEIADIHLLRWVRDNINDTSSLDTVFSGLLFKVEATKKISSRLTISNNKNYVENKIKTENVTFNNKFAIYCEDEDEAFYILTPQTIEKILAFEEHVKGKVHLCFADDGHLYCACTTNEDYRHFGLWKHHLKKAKTVSSVSESIDSDIRYVLSLIDELFKILDEQEESS